MKQITNKYLPSSYNTSDYSYSSIANEYPLSNPIGKDSSNTTMCRINIKTGSRAESWVYYDFDFSDIPENATIDSISAKIKCSISNTTSNRITTRTAQLYSGNTPKGTASTLTTNTTVINMTVGTWTRDELQNCRLKLYAKRGTNYTTSTYYIGFYGADITVTYTYQDITGHFKKDGVWKTITKVYQKSNNSWNEISITDIDTNKHYRII